MLAQTRLLLILLTALLVACAPAVEVRPQASAETVKAPLEAEQPGLYWWQLRFKLAWPEGEYPDFSTHLLIADQILLPAIVEHEGQLSLWRFHRRAARTPSGHQFSFIFLSDPDTAAKIDRQVRDNPLTTWLSEQGMIEKTRLNKRSKEELAKLEDTSDPNWPAEIQRSWPWFIMGASQSWLMMVHEISGRYPLEGRVPYAELAAHYRQVDDELNEQWREYGQHAYLHHLSAVYGYRPMRIRTNDLKTF